MALMSDQHTADDRLAWETWLAERGAAVAGPVGNLALVDYRPVGEDAVRVPGLPAEFRRESDEPGVRVRPTGPGLTIAEASHDAWRPVTEETFVARLGATGLPLLRSGGITVDVFSLDGSDYELRVYDEAAPKLASFAGISHYDYDPAWRITGRLSAYAETAQVPWGFTRSTDTGHTMSVPGAIEVGIAGADYRFTAFSDGGQLVLVFADGTTGAESYAPGRFLRIDPPVAGSDTVTLDFNRAFVPPCGFSDFYSCPIPPAENRVAVPVRAGERSVTWRDL